MEARKIVQSDFKHEVERYIKAGWHGIVYGIADTPYVQVHRKMQVDESKSTELGYEIIELYHNGGTLVLNPGDVLMGHFGEPENDWYSRFTSYFVDWLKDKKLDAVREGNDVLVDGYKVSAYCVTRYGRIDYTGVFVGVNTNLDHIKAICKKPMKKVPKGLSEYGITSEEVEHMFVTFCEQDGRGGA